MNRMFFLFVFWGCFLTLEKIEAFSLFGSKKNTEITALGKVSSASNVLGKLLASISTSTDSSTQKNWSGENDVSTLLALRIFCKNSSEFFYWLDRVFDFLKTNFEKLQKAQKDLESANAYTGKVEAKMKKVSDAENKLATATEAVSKAVDVIFGNLLMISVANVKSSATILMLSIKQLDFSQANIDTLRKNFTNLKKKTDEISAEVKNLESTMRNIGSACGDEIEIQNEKIEKLVDDINTILDIISAVCNYYQDEAPENITDNLLERSSLLGDTEKNSNPKNNSDDDDHEEDDDENEDDE